HQALRPSRARRLQRPERLAEVRDQKSERCRRDLIPAAVILCRGAGRGDLPGLQFLEDKMVFVIQPDELVLRYAIKMVGIKYHWGGDNPLTGFDCGGLVLELMRARGTWPHGNDTTAAGIHDTLKKAGKQPKVTPAFGDVAFYGGPQS